jgi:hypothetical protein
MESLHFILTMSHWSSVLTLLSSRHKGPEFKTPGGTHVKPGFSCWRCLATWPTMLVAGSPSNRPLSISEHQSTITQSSMEESFFHV